MPICEFCKKQFTKVARGQRFCRRDECITERKRISNREGQKAYHSIYKSSKKNRLKLCVKCETRKTNNYFGICDECRERILDGIDYNLMYNTTRRPEKQ